MYKNWKISHSDLELKDANDFEVTGNSDEEIMSKKSALQEQLTQKYENNIKEYEQVANWCNDNGYHIEDNGEYYYVEKNKEPTEAQKAEFEIEELKNNLSSTDYIVTKIAEASTEEEKSVLREEYAQELEQRKIWRARINELEKVILNEGELLKI